MLPRLEAQRQLADYTAMAVAFGTMARADARRFVGGLRRQARGAVAAVHATPQALAAMGVAVVMAPVAPPPSPGADARPHPVASQPPSPAGGGRGKEGDPDG